MVEKSFGDYNRAVSDVLQEELLLNIVRRRYFESPQFMALNNISTSKYFTTDASLVGGRNPWFQITSANVGVGTSDLPTYNIQPQQGSEIATKLHEQVPLDVFAQLSAAGYPIELILIMVAQDFGGVRGVDVGVGDKFKPGSPQYIRLLSLIKSLEMDDKLVMTDVVWEEPYFEHPFAPEVFTPGEVLTGAEKGNSYASLDGGNSFYVTNREFLPAIWIEPAYRNTSAARELMQLLNLDPDPLKRVWRLENIKVLTGPELKGESGASDRIAVRTRSFYGVLNLLSHGVVVPDESENAAAYELTSYLSAVQNGTSPDITSFFKVSTAKTKPTNTSVAVKYRGDWYYIDDLDRSSKRVFNALYDLYNLQVAPASAAGGAGATVLTLPVR